MVAGLPPGVLGILHTLGWADSRALGPRARQLALPVVAVQEIWQVLGAPGEAAQGALLSDVRVVVLGQVLGDDLLADI